MVLWILIDVVNFSVCHILKFRQYKNVIIPELLMAKFDQLSPWVSAITRNYSNGCYSSTTEDRDLQWKSKVPKFGSIFNFIMFLVILDGNHYPNLTKMPWHKTMNKGKNISNESLMWNYSFLDIFLLYRFFSSFFRKIAEFNRYIVWRCCYFLLIEMLVCTE